MRLHCCLSHSIFHSHSPRGINNKLIWSRRICTCTSTSFFFTKTEWMNWFFFLFMLLSSPGKRKCVVKAPLFKQITKYSVSDMEQVFVSQPIVDSLTVHESDVSFITQSVSHEYLVRGHYLTRVLFVCLFFPFLFHRASPWTATRIDTMMMRRTLMMMPPSKPMFSLSLQPSRYKDWETRVGLGVCFEWGSLEFPLTGNHLSMLLLRVQDW